MSIEKLVRKNILALKPYCSARSEFNYQADIFLDANENPFKQLKYNRYPDPLQKILKSKLADLKKIKSEHIFCGNGSDEAIDILIRIFCEPKQDAIVITPPTYGVYEVYANVADVKVEKCPLNADFSLPAKQLIKQLNDSKINAKLLFINNPNNPTGNCFAQDDIIYLIQNFKGIIVVDEAYIDFADTKSFISLIDQYPNLVVLQTFSKAFGMAGLRIGTAFASTTIISLMNKVKLPYNINAFSQAYAIKILSDKKQITSWVQTIIAQRKLLFQELQKFSFVVNIYPSQTNYILLQVSNANELYQFLLVNKIVVRNRHSEIKNCIRISVGTENENKKLLSVFKKYNPQ